MSNIINMSLTLNELKSRLAISQFNELKPFFEGADFIDVKVYKGKSTLPGFVASMLSYYPWWLILLYRIRQLLVHIFGLVKHEAPDELPDLKAGDISFTPGDQASFFIVRRARKDIYWISETPEDKHLKAFFGVVVEALNEIEKRFYVITSVYYKHWSGPVYFNLIRPFHHLVVSRMARFALEQQSNIQP